MTRGHGKFTLKRQSRVPSLVPVVWLMTDERIATPDLLRAIGRLPRGAAIIVRHYSLAQDERRVLFDTVRKATRRRGAFVLLAGDAETARAWGADGHHGQAAARFRANGWLHSAPVHDHRELLAAQRVGADVMLVSPLFATRSHPCAPSLGVARFAALARTANVPVIALGGVRPRHARLVRRLGAAGFAAIDGLVSSRP
jgi:thiamine-phosphate pyrophosphorylase